MQRILTTILGLIIFSVVGKSQVKRIIRDHQVVYDFIKMQPSSYYEFTIPIKDVFQGSKAIEDFNSKELNKFDYKTKFKNASTKKAVVNKYKLLFEFALYKDVTVLCGVRLLSSGK